MSPVVHWLVLWLCNPLVTGSNPSEDGQRHELFREIALKNQRFLFLKCVNVDICGIYAYNHLNYIYIYICQMIIKMFVCDSVYTQI